MSLFYTHHKSTATVEKIVLFADQPSRATGNSLNPQECIATLMQLSIEQIACLIGFARGMNTTQTAASLNVSTAHIQRLSHTLRRMLGVRNKRALIALAQSYLNIVTRRDKDDKTL